MSALEAPFRKKPSVVVLRPQPRQELFLSSDADVAVYGGSAYSGKTYALLLDPLRFKDLPGMQATYFRRTMKQADNPGGLWDESCSLYASFGATPMAGLHEHRFAGGMTVKLAGMEHATDRFAWDGAQIPLLYFDQLEHFEWEQFWYMITRNRDPSGRVHPYCRATCNPDPDSWLGRFLEWWIDQDIGYAIPARSGVVRWCVRLADDSTAWGGTREELLAAGHGDPSLPVEHPEQPWISVTFIHATIYDNAIGMERDPGYLAKLRNAPRVERERLLGDAELGGNWKVRAAAGLLFRREWCAVIDRAPDPRELEATVRAWDLAATEATESNSPAWTVGVKVARYRRRDPKASPRWVVLDARRGQLSPAKVERRLTDTARDDGRGVRIRGPQDPGQAGKAQAERLVGLFAGYDARFRPETGDKVTRFNPVSAQAERGNLDFVRGVWNEDVFRSLEAFPDGKVKDDADALSAAFDELLQYGGLIDVAGGSAVSRGARDDDGEDLGGPSVDDSGSPWGIGAR